MGSVVIVRCSSYAHVMACQLASQRTVDCSCSSVYHEAEFSSSTSSDGAAATTATSAL